MFNLPMPTLSRPSCPRPWPLWAVVLAALPLSLSLSGCATYKWVHPTQKESRADVNLLECEKQAVDMYPVVVVQETHGGSYQPPVTKCETVNGAAKCETKGPSSTPPSTTIKDANENNRLQAKELCMRSRGWQKVEVKQ